MRIAICGIRGIPACYGGFETFAEEMSTRLVERGHHVVVYGRKHVISTRESTYRGVSLRLLWAPQHKYFETPAHSLLCFLHLLKFPVDVVLVCNAANSPFIFIPRLRGIPAAINLDGIERKRAKWNALGRLWYRLGELCSVLFASEMISDAEVIRTYYRDTYKRDSRVIRYGCHRVSTDVADRKLHCLELYPSDREIPAIFGQLGVKPGKYLLYVSRLEPENNAHVVIEAYNALEPAFKQIPLLIVGDAPYASAYIDGLHKAAGENVIFAGYRFGEDYKALQLNAYAYIQATEVGGTHPALVEAMGFANCIIANETPENVEVLADAGLFYSKNSAADLTQRMIEVLSTSTLLLELRTRAFERAKKHFDWEEITSSYEELFREMTSR